MFAFGLTHSPKHSRRCQMAYGRKQHIKCTKYIDIDSDIRYPTNNDQCVVETDQGRNEKLDVKSCLSNGNKYIFAHGSYCENSKQCEGMESGERVAWFCTWLGINVVFNIFFFAIYDSAQFICFPILLSLKAGTHCDTFVCLAYLYAGEERPESGAHLMDLISICCSMLIANCLSNGIEENLKQ